MSADRAATILARFNSAHNDLMWKLRDSAVDSNEHVPNERHGWSAAQIGWHVALTNDLIAGVLKGDSPMAQPAPPDFRESFDPSSLPPKVKTMPALEPPQIIGLDAAVERLRTSAHHVAKAIAALTPERGAGYCVSLPFGTLSLFELADFSAVHAARHATQLRRVVGKA